MGEYNKRAVLNGAVWKDCNGETIHAHGGCMLKQDDYFYWYGEDRRDNCYVSCYRSRDMIHWEFRNHILTTESRMVPDRVKTQLVLKREDNKKVNLERPKVLYNKKTKKFVLWAHYENGMNYSEAACAVATCETPDGDFVYHGHFNPLGYMSRDCTLFQEADGTAYFISSARNNADIHIYRLQEDYMNIDELTGRLWQGEYREAPAVFRREGKLYMLTSYCTGWKPNQGKYAVAENMEGRWSSLEEFGDATTYDTQPACVCPIQDEEQTRYLYIADRWDGDNYNNSRYVFLYLEFDPEGKMLLNYQPEFSSPISAPKGEPTAANAGEQNDK